MLQVGECFKGLGIEHLTLETIAFDNHWSLVKTTPSFNSVCRED